MPEAKQVHSDAAGSVGGVNRLVNEANQTRGVERGCEINAF